MFFRLHLVSFKTSAVGAMSEIVSIEEVRQRPDPKRHDEALGKGKVFRLVISAGSHFTPKASVSPKRALRP